MKQEKTKERKRKIKGREGAREREMKREVCRGIERKRVMRGGETEEV